MRNPRSPSARHLGGLGRGAARVGDPHVGDQARAARRAQRQDLAQAPFQQRVVAGLQVGHAIAMAECQRALADALEHDGIEPALGHQVHGRIEPVGREAGPVPRRK